jgi:hypothetical protein
VRRRALGIALAGVVVVDGACRLGAFACGDDVDCADGGESGVCEPEGACSFPDGDCPSGRRYGERSPKGLAGECVETVDTTESSGNTLAATGPDPSTSSTDAEASATATTSDEGDDATAETSAACPSGWWDCEWQRRIALDLPATAMETFDDVPVLVLLGTPRIDPNDAAADGADLRFVTDDGMRVPHEIERWAAQGTSVVWISVPTLGPGDGPRLWMYYGNAAADDDQDPHAVWSSEHVGVWHMQPGFADATANGHDGVPTGAVADAEGHLAGSKEFFAVEDRIDVRATESLDDAFLAGATISAWVRPDTWGGTDRGRIADKTAGSAGGFMFYVSGDAGGEIRFRQGYVGGQVIWRGEGGMVTLDGWAHVAATFAASVDERPRLFVDGVEQEVVLSGDAAMGDPVSDVGQDVVIGNSDVPNRWFDGRIDELRIERTVRSPAWIELQVRSTTDTLVAYSAPEALEDVP